MDGLDSLHRWGRIEIEDLGEVQLSRENDATSLVVRRSQYTWSPSPELDLPRNSPLLFGCDLGSDGIRRFTPREPAAAFILRASLVGHAILEMNGFLPRKQRQLCHAKRLFFQQSNHLGEYFRRRFRRRGDLLVTQAARIEHESKDILPVDLGVAAGGHGTRWSVNDLLTKGREAAISAGLPANDEELLIRIGLFEAASVNPFNPAELTHDELRSLIRLGLFDFDDEISSVDDEVKTTVIECLMKALDRHLDDSHEQFHKWFFEQVDNLVHQIAKRKHRTGPIGRNIVRSVLLDFIFDAHGSVAHCVSVAMRAFAAALPHQLSERESQLFGLLYMGTPALGGFPLIMLHDRFPPLRESTIECIDQPADNRAAGTFLRVLAYYAAMVRNRREADRRYKRLAKHRNANDRPALHYGLDVVKLDIGGSANRQSAVIATLLENRNATCLCTTTDDWKVAEVPAIGEGEFDIGFCCRTCGHAESIRTSKEELKLLASRLRHGNEDFDSTT